MSDLIKREDAIKAVWEWVTNREYDYTNATHWLQKRIESIPSAERKGEWIGWLAPNGIDCGAECSNCGKHIGSVPSYGTNFCPNCGARMKGADDEQ